MFHQLLRNQNKIGPIRWVQLVAVVPSAEKMDILVACMPGAKTQWISTIQTHLRTKMWK